jgi:GNAT superfamily N-acetyltransferase
MFLEFYQDYLNEKGMGTIICNDNGFMVWRICANELWIDDIYIKPEARRKHKASEFIEAAKEIARLNNCAYVVGRVSLMHKDYADALKFHLGIGVKIIKMTDTEIFTALEV